MLEDKIYQDYVAAMKAKDKAKSEFLSFLRAELKYTAIGLKKDKLDDTDTLKTLQKQKKRLQDTKDSIGSSGRKDILEKAEKELALLENYLPKPLDESALTQIVEQVVKDTGASSMKDMGRVMKEVMAKTAGRADAKKLNEIVRQKIA